MYDAPHLLALSAMALCHTQIAFFVLVVVHVHVLVLVFVFVLDPPIILLNIMRSFDRFEYAHD